MKTSVLDSPDIGQRAAEIVDERRRLDAAKERGCHERTAGTQCSEADCPICRPGPDPALPAPAASLGAVEHRPVDDWEAMREEWRRALGWPNAAPLVRLRQAADLLRFCSTPTDDELREVISAIDAVLP